MKFHRLPHFCEGWETVARRSHFESDHLVVTTETVRSPAHPESRRWTVAHRKAAVVVAPLTRDGKLVLIRQERVAIRAAIWEMPAGQVDDANGTASGALEATALRELLEETGYELSEEGKLIALGHFFSSPGFTDEVAYFFLARGVVPARAPAQAEDSILDCRCFSIAELARMIVQNEIRDANTLSLCAKLAAAGHLNFSR